MKSIESWRSLWLPCSWVRRPGPISVFAWCSSHKTIRQMPIMIANKFTFRLALVLSAVVLVPAGAVCGASQAAPRRENTPEDWPVVKPVELPQESHRPWVDIVVGPPVFTKARHDLGDLRLFDATGGSVPYALRIRERRYQRQEISANTFNRSVGPDGSREISIDLGSAGEHNEVEVVTPGREFRRRAVLEGSDDGEQWKELAEQFLIRYEVEELWLEDKPAPETPEPGTRVAEDRWLSYPPSRFRYLRVRVFQDPLADTKPVEPVRVAVRKTVAIPGERRTDTAQLGSREPSREDGAAASAWMLDLGGGNVPVSRLTVQIGNPEFVRDYRIEAGPSADEMGPFTRFQFVSGGVWRRRAGEQTGPMVATFPEVRAARLRLTIIDRGNPPLDLQSARYSAAARQVVFARDQLSEDQELRLYYGNPDALPPAYDFARNLPDQLEPPPDRGSLGPEQENPEFVPEPKPFTERWPGAIYAVLTTVAALLAGIVFSVGRRAVRQHDQERGASGAQENAPPEPE